MVCYRSASGLQQLLEGYLPSVLDNKSYSVGPEVDQILAWVDVLLQRDSDSPASAWTQVTNRSGVGD